MLTATQEASIQTQPVWNAKAARAAFISAFTDFKKPTWIDHFELLPEPENRDQPIAKMTCKDESALIVILPSRNAVLDFWDEYPEAEMVVIPIQENMLPHKILDRVIGTLGNARIC